MSFAIVEDITQALSRLTEPTVAYTLPSLGTVVTKATKKLQIREEVAPIPAEMLSEILLVRVFHTLGRPVRRRHRDPPPHTLQTGPPPNMT